MKIELNPKERQLIIDCCEDTLYRLHYDKKVEKNKIYRNAVRRLKSMMEFYQDNLQSKPQNKKVK